MLYSFTDIEQYLNDNLYLLDDRYSIYTRYTGETVPIKSRTNTTRTETNNKIVNDFRGMIVSSFTGYLFGKPITYKVKESGTDKRKRAKFDDEIQKLVSRCNLPYLDSLTGKYCSICGYGARLLYIDKNGEVAIENIPPYQTLFILDKGGNIETALRFYSSTTENIITKYLEVYDAEIYTLYQATGSETYHVTQPERLHLFDGIPLIRFENNDELMGDFERVESLIDTYDVCISDAANELQEHRLALLLLTGAQENDEMSKAKTEGYGLIQVPEGADLKWLLKELPTGFLQEVLDRLENNIYRFSQVVDMSDEKFSGSGQSGESRKWKLLAMENKAAEKQRCFERGLREQFRLLAGIWKKKGLGDFTVDDLEFLWTRNLPADLSYSADVFNSLYGKIPYTLALSQLPFVSDTAAVADQFQQEQEQEDEQEEHRHETGLVEAYNKK